MSNAGAPAGGVPQAIPLPEPSGRNASMSPSERYSVGSNAPWWYLLLDRFGFPTAVAIALGWMLFRMINAEQDSHAASQAVMQKAFDQINDNLVKLNSQAGDQQRTLNDIKDALNRTRR